ncbi:MAG: hypothetical protein FWD90_06560 [Defluviitaleaceae bacterium]|nr:hypothetical protein [Defluviitaleaceae bacterium]
MKEKMINFLLENANPSIKRRVKSEILNNVTPQEAATYQEQTLTEPMILKITALQKDNGWIGNGFNGGLDTQEGATKYLAEKAINKDTPVLKRAMDAFINIPLDDLCYNDRGRVFDEFKYPCLGMNLHRCACIARAGYHDIIDISPQIQLSVDSFKRVLEVESVFDILHPMKKNGKTVQVFNDYEKWVGRHHLDMLAHTQSWRSEDNIKTIAKSVNEMMRTDNPELFEFIPGSQVGCMGGCFPAQGLTVMGSGVYPSPILCEIGRNGKDYNGYYHFELIEWFARCGIVSYVPALQKIVEEIATSIDDNGVCRLPMVALDVFKCWGTFGGLQLEIDWKSKTRKACDITFRALLILHYSKFI